jgi:hypothetical protein
MPNIPDFGRLGQTLKANSDGSITTITPADVPDAVESYPGSPNTRAPYPTYAGVAAWNIYKAYNDAKYLLVADEAKGTVSPIPTIVPDSNIDPTIVSSYNSMNEAIANSQ